MIKESESQVHRYQPIDAIKGLSIIFIVILHVDPKRKDFLEFLYWATVDQAVPILFIAAGFISAIYYQKRFSVKSYLKSRYVRIYIPLYILALTSLLIHYFVLNKNLISLVPYWLFGYMKYFAYGGYFVTCYIEWILIFPFVYYVTKKNNNYIIMVVIFSFIIHMLFYLNKGAFLDLTNNEIWHFRAIVITYLPHITLGLLYGILIVRDELSPVAKNFIFLIALLLSFLLYKNGFIASRQGWDNDKLFNLIQILRLDLCIFYSFFLFIVLFNVFERTPRILNLPFSFFGKLSYEIFLVQAVFFQLVKEINSAIFLDDLLGVLLSLSVIIFLALLVNQLCEKYIPKFIHEVGVIRSNKL